MGEGCEGRGREKGGRGCGVMMYVFAYVFVCRPTFARLKTSQENK